MPCAFLCVSAFSFVFFFCRSRVAVAKGARGQARQEEPELDLACDRGWCE